MNVETLFKSLKAGKINPVYLILGNQEYLNNLIKKKFIQIIPIRERTMNYAQYDLENNSLSPVLGDVVSAPFLGRYRLIIVNNPYFLTGKRSKIENKQNINDLVKYLKAPVKTTILVFMAPYSSLDGRKKITKILKNNAVIVDLNHISEQQARIYVYDQIINRGYQISNNTLDKLIQRTDGQLSVIMNELPKLLLYCYNTKNITDQAVDSLVVKSLNQNVFDLVNKVLKKDVNSAVVLYNQLISENKQPLQINAILISQFRLLLQVMILSHDSYSQGSLSRILRVHPYRIKLALITIRRFDIKQLINDYLGLVKMEVDLKSTNQSSRLLFELFMLKLVKKNS